MAKPGAPLYKGGIVKNPEFNEELNGWIAGGEAKIESAKSVDGNRYCGRLQWRLSELQCGEGQTVQCLR